MSNKRGRLLIVSGPTASGKSTLWRRLVLHDSVAFSVSATTRQMRRGEVDGRDYRFLSKENFEQLIADGALLEYAEVHGCYYGTLRSSIEDAIDVGLDIVLEIDVEGARQLRESDLPQVSFFVNPPSLEILAQRLRDRGTETEDQMARRLSIVEREMACADLYDHVVVNDDLERMIAEVGEILGIQIPPTPEIEAKA